MPPIATVFHLAGTVPKIGGRHGRVAAPLGHRVEERPRPIIAGALCAAEYLYQRPVGRLLVGDDEPGISVLRVGRVLQQWRRVHPWYFHPQPRLLRLWWYECGSVLNIR